MRALVVVSILFLIACKQDSSPVVAASIVPHPSATPTPTPTPSPSPSPSFTHLNCGYASGNVYCQGANLGAITMLDFSQYLPMTVYSVTVQNNLMAGQYNCSSEYLSQPDCSCLFVIFYDPSSHTYSSTYTFCGTGVSASNWLEYL